MADEKEYDKGYDARWEADGRNPKPPAGSSQAFLNGWHDADCEIKAEMRTPTPD